MTDDMLVDGDDKLINGDGNDNVDELGNYSLPITASTIVDLMGVL